MLIGLFVSAFCFFCPCYHDLANMLFITTEFCLFHLNMNDISIFQRSGFTQIICLWVEYRANKAINKIIISANFTTCAVLGLFYSRLKKYVLFTPCLKESIKKYCCFLIYRMTLIPRNNFLLHFLSIFAHIDKGDKCLLFFPPTVSFLSSFFLVYLLSARQLYKWDIGFRTSVWQNRKVKFFWH